jgi:hypothetical protein
MHLPALPALGNGSMPSMKNSVKKPSASSASKQKARVEASGMYLYLRVYITSIDALLYIVYLFIHS